MDEILEKLLQEEQELQFTQFNEDTAWELGSRLVEQARSMNLPVTIDISRGARLSAAAISSPAAELSDAAPLVRVRR